jgi:hypothetical protein
MHQSNEIMTDAESERLNDIQKVRENLNFSSPLLSDVPLSFRLSNGNPVYFSICCQDSAVSSHRLI